MAAECSCDGAVLSPGAGSVRELRKLYYGELKARGAGAQAAQHVIKRVVGAYTTLRANIKAAKLGPEGCKRRRKAEAVGKRITGSRRPVRHSQRVRHRPPPVAQAALPVGPTALPERAA
ncbi:hypothetical protein QFZ22_009644 [Streptomyces canus]|uniref:Transposase n=1 Tax=Streptomyces canus TaxID=58343 RepID=A0AAW8FUS8_9ACTN|nr:hypothetical protein [Streptomyces canus]MDQ0913572.1 hypothetical protein [Streptomyces canus]